MKRKLRPSDKMEMEVMNALSSVLSDIRDDAVSVCHTVFAISGIFSNTVAT